MQSTKDRLLELRSKQRDAPLGDEGNGGKPGKADPMMEFWEDVEDIGIEIEQVKKIVEDLRLKHKHPITDREWQTVEEMLAEVKRMANRIRGKLKRMDIEIKGNRDDDSAEYRIMRTQHLTLSRSFIDVMKVFNERQQAYREHATATIKQHLGAGISQTQLDHLLEGQAGAHLQLQQVTRKQHLTKQHLHEVEARHRDIKRLENNIRELHDMWMDMAMIVERSGDMVDRIEFMVGQAKDYTQGGAANTKKALENYKQAKKKKRILKAVLITLAVVLVLALVLGLMHAFGIY